MSEVLDLLGVTDPVARSAHAHFLNETVKAFSFALEVSEGLPTIHEAVATIGKFKAQLENALEAMKGMHPQIRVVMGLAAPPFSPTDWSDLINLIERLTLTLGQLDRSKASGKPKLSRRLPDTQFEQTVAFLMLRIRDATGELATAKPADSRYGDPAKLTSIEAQAIWMLLKHLAPAVTESRVANRIVAIRREYNSNLGKRFSHYDLVGGGLNFDVGIS